MGNPEISNGQNGTGKASETVVTIQSTPRPVPDLEAHLRAIRSNHRWSVLRVLRLTGLQRKRYRALESGGPEKVTPNTAAKVIDLIGTRCAEDEPHAVEAVTLLTALQLDEASRGRIKDIIDDARFTGTTIFTEKPEYSPAKQRELYYLVYRNSFGDAVRNIREAEGLTQRELKEEAGISKIQLLLMEQNKVMPGLPTINIFIDWSPLDPSGMAAQLLRLKSQKKKAMKINQLNTETVGDIIRYLRIAEGHTQPQLAKILGRNKSTVHNIETTSAVRYPVDFYHWLGDDPINAVLQFKIHNPGVPLPAELLQNVLSGRFLFLNQNQTIARNRF